MRRVDIRTSCIGARAVRKPSNVCEGPASPAPHTILGRRSWRTGPELWLSTALTHRAASP
jgi:hypothetical protein